MAEDRKESKLNGRICNEMDASQGGYQAQNEMEPATPQGDSLELKYLDENLETDPVPEEIVDGELQYEEGSTQSSEGVITDIKIHCEINIEPSAVQSKADQTPWTPYDSPHKVDNNFIMEEGIRSWTPSDCNEESHLFNMGILHESMVNLLLLEHRADSRDKRMKYKNGTRLSLSFTNERMREIERHNQILVRKIFHQTPSLVKVTPFNAICVSREVTIQLGTNKFYIPVGCDVVSDLGY